MERSSNISEHVENFSLNFIKVEEEAWVKDANIILMNHKPM